MGTIILLVELYSPNIYFQNVPDSHTQEDRNDSSQDKADQSEEIYIRLQ